VKKTAKIGMTLVAVLALPVALATEWVTHKEVVAGTKTVAIKASIVQVSDDASQNAPPVENLANEMKIYASF
jgi:hypothetical protein